MSGKDDVRIRVWREPDWNEGDLAWRAQAYNSDGKVVSTIGAATTREEAIADCIFRRFPVEPVYEWLSLDDARAIAAKHPDYAL